ncbi:enoyl-CoA hydratase/isomerase family protein [Camelimonas abortus]|uniref:Enoyl-CoA hydratase/isomerase family protein n=1 Tax=Camelimonas abortus TaxID=1017184 RepID=A0ABV7LEW1_9HYPH
MEYQHLLIEQNGPVIRATMNRPDRLNALNRQLVEELRHFFTDLYWRDDVRVVVLTGAGRGFCAGLDLKDRSNENAETTTWQSLRFQRRIADIVVAMRRCPQPIVALVNGPASGGGFALALASDIRIVTPEVKMNAAFIRIGLSACDIGVSYFLPRLTNASVASQYMLTGRFIDAETALRLGLAAEIATRENLDAVGQSYVDDLLHATPLGLRLTKEALNHAIDAGGLEAVIAMEDRNQILSSRSKDFREGVAAFLEKRKPVYSDA